MTTRGKTVKRAVVCGLVLGLGLAFLAGGACKKDSRTAGKDAREAFEKTKEVTKEGLEKTGEIAKEGLEKGGDIAKEGLQQTKSAAKQFQEGWKEGGK